MYCLFTDFSEFFSVVLFSVVFSVAFSTTFSVVFSIVFSTLFTVLVDVVLSANISLNLYSVVNISGTLNTNEFFVITRYATLLFVASLKYCLLSSPLSKTTTELKNSELL